MNIKTEKISGGSVLAGQIMLILFFTPLSLWISYIIIAKNTSMKGIVFLIIFLLIAFLIIRLSYLYADIYISEHYLIIKKIFYTKKISLSEIKEIDKALAPLTYFIKFENNNKIYLSIKYSELPSIFFSNDPDKGLKLLKTKLHINE
jgi:Ca2+/Na+ antiporter